MAQQFRRDLRLLVAEYGPSAVDAALDELPEWSRGAGLAPLIQAPGAPT
jgi:hypothetical protein